MSPIQKIITFIGTVPKPIIAVVVLMLGFAFIVYNDPPKTVCDSQLELFKQNQKEFLYSRPGLNGTQQGALFGELYSLCKADNSPGGCFEYFVRLKKFNQDLDNIPHQCSETAKSESLLRTVMLSSMKLMVQISWGDRGPASTNRRNGWLDASDLSLFCDLRQQADRILGKETVSEWQTKTLNNLPGVETLDAEQTLQRSLFATPCAAYR